MEGQEVEPRGETAQAPEAPRPRAKWKLAALVVLAGVVLFAAWVAFSGAWKPWGAVASLDGGRITRADLEQHIEFLVKLGRLRPQAFAEPAGRREAERAALDDLITRRLLLAEAQRLKIAVEPGEEDLAFRKAHGGQPGEFKLSDMAKKTGQDVEGLRAEVRRQLLMTRLADKVTEGITVSDEDVAKYYDGHRQAFTAPGEARLRLLIVESKEEGERLREEAVKGADFAALARRHSKGGARERGGDMGWVDPRVLPPAIAAAVAAIPKAGVTPVVEAAGRFYVVQVEGRREGRQIPLAEAQDHIREVLTAQRKQARFAEWFAERRRAARVEIYL